MASMGWRFFVDRSPWNGISRLFIQHIGFPERRLAFVQPFTIHVREPGEPYDTPTLSENYEESTDNIGDVTGFLQAALDAAWELGLRPKGFDEKAHGGELAATRAHLEDMRTLALPPKAST